MTKFVSGHPPPTRPVAVDLVALAAEKSPEPMVSQLYYDAIDVAGAQRVLRFLKVRQAARTASEGRESA